MREVKRRPRPIGLTIIASCVAIVLLLVASIVFATYASFSNSTRTAVGTQTRELSTQIIYNYENYISEMIDASNTVQEDIEKFDLGTAQGAELFSSYLADVVHFKNDIISVALFNAQGTLRLASSDGSSAGDDVTGQRWFLEATSDETVHAFSVPYSVEAGTEYRTDMSKLFKYAAGGKQAVLKIEMSFERFISLIAKSNLGDGGHVTIVDDSYNVVYTSLGEGVDESELKVIKDIILGSTQVHIDGHDMSVNVDTLAGTKWRICVFINVDSITQIERNFFSTTLVVSICVLALSILLFMYIARHITDPIKELEQAMRKVEKSDYFRMENVELVASAEVEALTDRFNKMMRKISELMERVVTEQNAQRKSELKALQNQINPHFLYNTLDSIVWLIENNKNNEAKEMVVALARLFRISISKGLEVIPVRSEIEHVRNYLFIQSIRYVDSFDYTFDVDPSTLDCPTMKLILQPLVENCIYHGLKNKIDKGHIRVSVKRDGDYIDFTVSDNGYGIDKQTIAKLYASFKDGEPSEGVGLKNIYTRVRMYYNGRAEMKIESVLDEGTSITIREPIEKP